MREIDKSFQNGGCPLHVRQCLRCVVARHDPRLSFAIIAKAAGFQDRRGADLIKRCLKAGGVGDVGKRRSLKTQIPKKGLFRQPVLTDTKRLATRMDRGKIL